MTEISLETISNKNKGEKNQKNFIMKENLLKVINMVLGDSMTLMDLIIIVDGNSIKKQEIYYFITLRFINIEFINIKMVKKLMTIINPQTNGQSKIRLKISYLKLQDSLLICQMLIKEELMNVVFKETSLMTLTFNPKIILTKIQIRTEMFPLQNF